MVPVRLPRYCLRSLMIFILLSALVLAGSMHLARIDPLDLVDLKLRIFVLLPFLLLILAKLGLSLSFRLWRSKPIDPIDDPSMHAPQRDQSPS